MLLRFFGVISIVFLYSNAQTVSLGNWRIPTTCTDKSINGGKNQANGNIISKKTEMNITLPGTDKSLKPTAKLRRPHKLSGQKGVLWIEGVVPYYLNPVYYGSEVESGLIKSMTLIESVSCLRFRKLKSLVLEVNYMRNWLHFTNENNQRGCSHFDVNKQENYYEIPVVLGYDCLKPAQILHTLLHGVGLSDEITHPKRDIFVGILWDNIQPKYYNLFDKADDQSYNMKVEYDPQSVMHFHDRAFTINGRPTIVPLKPGINIDPSEQLSQLDKVKLRLIGGSNCGRKIFDEIKEKCKFQAPFAKSDVSQTLPEKPNDNGETFGETNDSKTIIEESIINRTVSSLESTENDNPLMKSNFNETLLEELNNNTNPLRKSNNIGQNSFVKSNENHVIPSEEGNKVPYINEQIEDDM